MDSLLDESDDTSELQATPCPPQCRPVNLIPDNKKSSSSIPDVGQQRQQPLGPSHRSNFALTVQLGRSLQKQATPPPGPPTRPKQAEISLDASDFDLSSGGAAKNNSEDVHRHAYGRGSNQLSAPDDRSRMSVSRSIDSFGNTRSEPFTDGFTAFESSFASGVGTLLPRHEYAANRQVTSTPRDQYADVQVTPRDHSDRRRQSYDQQQHQHQEYRRDDRGGNRQSRHDQPRDKPSRHESQHVTSFFVRDQGLLLKIQTSTGKCIWPKQLSTTNRPGSWIVSRPPFFALLTPMLIQRCIELWPHARKAPSTRHEVDPTRDRCLLQQVRGKSAQGLGQEPGLWLHRLRRLHGHRPSRFRSGQTPRTRSTRGMRSMQGQQQRDAVRASPA